MKDKPFIVRLSVFISIATFFLFILFAAYTDISQASREFNGSKTFLNVPEAQAYQDKVINTALSLNAKIASADISVTSPPRFSFHVILPISDTTPSIFTGDWKVSLPEQPSFPFGNRSSGIVGVWIGTAIIGLVYLGATITVFGWFELFRKHRD